MEINMIGRDDQLVNVIIAEAKGERLDSSVRENADNFAKTVADNPSPHNLYVLGQQVGFTVDEMLRPMSDVLNLIADYKALGPNDTPKFQIELEGIHAYIQAMGSTTPRSRIAHKNILLDSVLVSARPVISCAELKRGSVNIADLSAKAAVEMFNAKLGYIRGVLEANAIKANPVAGDPYYAEGTGLLKTGIDPMIRHWMRYGGVSVVGDIYMTSQFANLTGFAAATNPATKQFADNIIIEQNQNGFIGRYMGADVATMMNPYKSNSLTETVLNPKMLFIFPAAANANMRPLKAFDKGPVDSMEATHIDDKSYELRLDQEFGAGYVYGEQPYMSVYKDLTA